MILSLQFYFSFFLNAPAPPEIYTLSLHDALPISAAGPVVQPDGGAGAPHPRAPDREPGALAPRPPPGTPQGAAARRSEEHTSELQSHVNLVCRLLLEKKKKT